MRIDDLSAMGNIRGSDFENLIYSIGNGKGKLRSAIDGKNIPADEFSVICIMTAEKTITEEVWQKEGYRFKAGAEARLIEQPFIEPEDLKGNSDIRGFASALMDAVNNAYGEAGAEWLRALDSLGWSSIQIQLREHTKSFEDKMNSDYAAAMNLRPGHKIRAHTLYSVVYAAGIMSRAITGYSEEEIFTAVASNMAQEMLSNDMGGKRDAEAIEAFWDYLTGSINRMGAIAREGNKATAQRGGDESAGWIDMIDAGRGDECKTVFYLTKRQLNCAARDVCGMSGGELLSLLNKRNYHETPTDARGERDGTVQAWVRSGTSSSRTRLIKITQPPEDIED